MPRSTFHFPLVTILGVLAVIFLLPACQPEATPSQALPTVAELPTLVPTEAASPTPTLTETSAPTPTPTDTLVPTSTPFPTDTPAPTITSTSTPQSTVLAASTATQAILQAPTFATFTALPPGTLPPAGTPQQIADVVITRQQFQDAVNQKIPDYPTIQDAKITFAPNGIRVQLTALGGQAYITGDVLLSIQVSNGVAAISPTEITVNAAEPPDAYVEVVNGDFFLMMLDVLDTILKTRLGPEQNLENIVISGDNMLITLLVPQT